MCTGIVHKPVAYVISIDRDAICWFPPSHIHTPSSYSFNRGHALQRAATFVSKQLAWSDLSDTTVILLQRLTALPCQAVPHQSSQVSE